jgi:dephospho-CoA kinase
MIFHPERSPVIIAGLTGGIATGKSTVSGFLADAGARIVDADKIAQQVVKTGTRAFDDIVSFFGPRILEPGGELDRKRLGDIIFNDPVKKARLNAIVHPQVFKQVNETVSRIATRSPHAVVILDIPLLFETQMEIDLAEIIVVYAPERIQLTRLMARDCLDEDAALARIRSQMPIKEKRRRATMVIDNDGSLTRCRDQALAVYQHLKRRADNDGLAVIG